MLNFTKGVSSDFWHWPHISYNSFFALALGGLLLLCLCAPILIFSPLFAPCLTSPAFSAHRATIPSLIMAMTLPQAIAQMLTEMLPSGARGNERIHSAGYGTHPDGSQNIGCFAYQVLSPKLTPCVPSQRTLEVMLSKEARKDCCSPAIAHC